MHSRPSNFLSCPYSFEVEGKELKSQKLRKLLFKSQKSETREKELKSQKLRKSSFCFSNHRSLLQKR